LHLPTLAICPCTAQFNKSFPVTDILVLSWRLANSNAGAKVVDWGTGIRKMLVVKQEIWVVIYPLSTWGAS